ncbi:MAG TPA: polymer-forming cytoskeletal protein [Candidatus Binataceae bacterium]|nr:polymer-forming cytoskeletal protein [Candidatus Binataceae bacterium]
MALFSKEPEKSSKPQTGVSPQPTPLTQPVPSTATSAESKPSSIPSAPKMPQSAAESRAYLDSGAKIVGKLFFEGPARVDGQVEGEIAAKDSLTVGESAIITAHIKAAAVIVAGKVSGDITAAQKIEIRPTGKVLGNLTSPVVVIHEGSLFEGHCSMQPEAAHEDRKVTVFPKEERLAQAAGQKQA